MLSSGSGLIVRMAIGNNMRIVAITCASSHIEVSICRGLVIRVISRYLHFMLDFSGESLAACGTTRSFLLQAQYVKL